MIFITAELLKVLLAKVFRGNFRMFTCLLESKQESSKQKVQISDVGGVEERILDENDTKA
jgi:hypothetical protein